MADQGGDHERMTAVAGGDLSSMGEIYQNRHRPLFRFFYRMTNRQALAEDLVHEVFLRMIRYRHTYQKEGDARNEGAFEAWMYRIARNTLVDHARKHRHETAPGEGELEEIVSARPNPFETAAKRQDLALLYRAMRDLPEDKRELLVLARFHGLNYEQIGEILGCAPGTVKGRVFRAMKELGSIYSDLCKEKAS
ncbi:MAG TPA: RNA polymerase sigma factor [Bryobacteraceae bacterium]|nr:RNA polymerase sigma factor [Bryobacteraceae bacterium]